MKVIDVNKVQPDSSFEIYAELSKIQYGMIQNDEAVLTVPYGVSMKNRAGSRSLYFYCDNKETSQQLTEGLDNSGISWQLIHET